MVVLFVGVVVFVALGLSPPPHEASPRTTHNDVTITPIRTLVPTALQLDMAGSPR